MSEETKKVEQTEQEAKASELLEQDLDEVAGGGIEHVDGIDVVVKKFPGGRIVVKPSGSGSSSAV